MRAELIPTKTDFLGLGGGPEIEWVRLENGWYLTGRDRLYLD
jgi:hypothetical protein